MNLSKASLAMLYFGIVGKRSNSLDNIVFGFSRGFDFTILGTMEEEAICV